jgi:serpin B
MMTTDICVSIAHQTRFALHLASAICSPSNADGAADNAVFSPLSLHAALSLLAAGAGGATCQQLVAALGAEWPGGVESLHVLAEGLVQFVVADASGEGGPCIVFADGVFVDRLLPLKTSFKKVAVAKYKAESHSSTSKLS